MAPKLPVSKRAQSEERKRSALWGAMAAVLLGLFLLLDPIVGQALQRWSYDLLFAFRPVPPARLVNPVVVVYMDRSSHDLLGQPDNQAWHRTLHAELIRQLDRRGARAIVFDVLMDEPWTNKTLHPMAQDILVNRFGFPSNQVVGARVDETVQTALEQARCQVFLAAELDQHTDEKGVLHQSIKVPSDTVLPRTASGEDLWGLVNFPEESDDAIRRHNFSPSPPGLAARVTAGLGRPVEDPGRLRWINYYGPANTLTNIAYHKVLDPAATTSQFFSNKVIYVGRGSFTTYEGSRTRDEWATPYTRWHLTDTTGVEIQATAFLNFWNRDWLKQFPWWLELVVVVVVGTGFGYGLVQARPWLAARWAFLGFLVLVAGAYLLTWNMQYWYAWTIPALAQIPLALAWSVIVHTKVLYREKVVLENTLATLRTGHQAAKGGTDFTAAATAKDPGDRAPASQGGPDPGPRPGETIAPPIPDHSMLQCVGRGAYGEVWLARDIIGSFHAVKVVFKRNFSSKDPYLREFNGLKKFTPISRSHPGLVQILHIGRNEWDDYFYCIMEAGDDEQGGTEIHPDHYKPRNLARDLARRGNYPVRQCVELGLALSNALEFLHGKNLIHRDIKPSNIIFVHGQPKFADIGLVTEIAGTGRDVSFLGTEGFIAPEGPGTPAADVYSLGKLLYEASMGRDRQRFPELPTDLTRRSDEAHLLRLNNIILKACETSLEERYGSARALHEDLLALQVEMEETE